MSVVNPASLSSDQRPIGLRTRSDLVLKESVYQGEACWIIKDPLAMKYFRLQLPEFFVLQQLRNKCSYQDLKRDLERNFPEKTIRLETIQNLIVSFHRSSLLVSNSIGQAKPLRKRRHKELKQKALGLLSSLISLRLPGVDPERLLNFMYPKVKWFFSPVMTLIVFSACVLACALVLSNLSEFYSKLPDFQRFFAFDNIVFMGGILIFTKTIHEFGHGLMCKHFGGECHEIGFMLLVMTPAMFCNTSDSWILPNRWHRMAIGAAGMYVEVFMASICTFVWWYTHPGWIHYLALNIMFLSSVSTLLFNANPLLRYDGYFILSDFLEIPNLAQKSKLALISRIRVVCLGMKAIDAKRLPSQNQVAFAIFSVASFIYRWFVMIMIFWFLSKVFEPWGLAVLGHLMIAFSLTGMVGMPLWKLTKFFMYPGRFREVKRNRFLMTVAAFGLTAGFVCYYPFPQYVWGSCLIRPLEPQMVFVTQPGVLIEQAVKAGDVVKKGDVLAVLENRELELELLQITGEIKKLEQDLMGFELNRNPLLDSERLIVETRTQLKELKKRAGLKRLQSDPLVLRADRNGIVIPPPGRPNPGGSDIELGVWSGTPLDTENKNSFLERSTLFCMIGRENQFEAIVIIDQSDVKLVHPNQTGKIVLEQCRSDILRCKVASIAANELENVPRELSQTNGGSIAVKPTPLGIEEPVLKLFEVHVSLSSDDSGPDRFKLITGYYGVAKIRVGNSSLGGNLVRYLRNVVNFR